jgi:hypothetical protein
VAWKEERRAGEGGRKQGKTEHAVVPNANCFVFVFSCRESSAREDCILIPESRPFFSIRKQGCDQCSKWKILTTGTLRKNLLQSLYIFHLYMCTLLVKSKIKHELEKYQQENLQETSIVVEENNRTITISVVYCPPKHIIKKRAI